MHARGVEEMEIAGAGITLAGTLTTPHQDDEDSPHPLVICIHGSGPLDRDENTRHQKLNIFNVLAHELAGRGIACFRYDKRGIGASGGHYLSAGHSDLVADALAVARHFRQDRRFSRLFLLGHSEGTVIAPQVARGCPVEGLILLCPFVTPLEALLELQGAAMQRHIERAPGISGWFGRIHARLGGGVQAGNRRLIARVRGSEKAVMRQGLRRVEARWIRELLHLDPAALFAAVECPALVLVAGNDWQCPPADGAEIARIIGEGAQLTVIDGLSHLLRIEGAVRGYAGYGEQLSRPVAPQVLAAVTGWIAARAGRAPAAAGGL